MRPASACTSSSGREGVASSSVASGRPLKSASMICVSDSRTSTATASRSCARTCSSVGLRPRGDAPVAPSTSSPCSISSFTSGVTMPRATSIRRARSAREIGWYSRTRFRTIWRLISLVVVRVARWKLRGSIFRTWRSLGVGLPGDAGTKRGRHAV